jgi:hypothetical protein
MPEPSKPEPTPTVSPSKWWVAWWLYSSASLVESIFFLDSELISTVIATTFDSATVQSTKKMLLLIVWFVDYPVPSMHRIAEPNIAILNWNTIPPSAHVIHCPKSIQVFLIYYKVSRYLLTYRLLFIHILGSTATFYDILWKLEMSLGQCTKQSSDNSPYTVQ